jgi:hypothetical protein
MPVSTKFLVAFDRDTEGGLLNEKIGSQQRPQEFIRWMVLRMLYACRPGAACETIILRVLQTLEFDCEPDDVRQAVDYMQSVGLAEAGQHRRTGPCARLTALGIAVVEYNAQSPSGIGRPQRWRGSGR